MVEEVTAAELEDWLAHGESVQMVDVRHPTHFERGHLPGAENVPITHLIDRIEDIPWGETVVCVCPHGESSLQAARLIESYEGFPEEATVANLVDGLDAWEGELVTEGDEGQPSEAPF